MYRKLYELIRKELLPVAQKELLYPRRFGPTKPTVQIIEGQK